jgi:hypothetical protein
MTTNGRMGRLERLERLMVAPPGCDLCRHWDLTPVIVDDFGGVSQPAVCPNCGRLVQVRSVVRLTGHVRVERI